MAENKLVEKLSLHAASKTLPRVLVRHLEKGLLVSPSTHKDLKAAWLPRHAAYKHSSTPERTIARIDDVRPISGVSDEEQAAVLERVRRYPPYGTLKAELKEVRVARLVTPQLTVNLQRGVQLVSTEKSGSTGEMFEAAFRPRRGPLHVERSRDQVTQWSAAEHFGIEDADVRVHLPPQVRTLPLSADDPESDEAEALCFFVGRGTPFVAVNAIPTGAQTARFAISNGIHRAYRWALRGEEWIPAIFVQGPAGSPTGQIGDSTWGVLANPKAQVPLLSDFLRPEVTMRLDYRREVNRITLKWEYSADSDPVVDRTDFEQ